MHKKRTDVPNKCTTLYDVFDTLKVYKCTLSYLKIAYRAILCNMYILPIILDIKVYNSNKLYKNKEISKKVVAIIYQYAIIRYKQMRDTKGGHKMKYIGIIKREATTTVDGYSNAKTIKGALRDMGRYIEKNIDAGEGRLLQVANKEEAYDLLSIGNHDASNWGIEVEEVGCATKIDEEGNIQEYSEANFYVMVRFCN